MGPIPNTSLPEVYNFSDFSICSFNLSVAGLTKASHLKANESLCYGLPLLVRSDESAADIPELRPFVFDFHKDPDSINKILKVSIDKSGLSSLARLHLDWDVTLKVVVDYFVFK